MSKYRRAARIDSNQNEMVAELRKIPRVTIEVGHDDFLLGITACDIPFMFWVECKNPDKLKKNGEYRKGAIKPDQVRIRETFTGPYIIASSANEVIEYMTGYFAKLGMDRVAWNLQQFLKEAQGEDIDSV